MGCGGSKIPEVTTVTAPLSPKEIDAGKAFREKQAKLDKKKSDEFEDSKKKQSDVSSPVVEKQVVQESPSQIPATVAESSVSIKSQETQRAVATESASNLSSPIGSATVAASLAALHVEDVSIAGNQVDEAKVTSDANETARRPDMVQIRPDETTEIIRDSVKVENSESELLLTCVSDVQEAPSVSETAAQSSTPADGIPDVVAKELDQEEALNTISEEIPDKFSNSTDQVRSELYAGAVPDGINVSLVESTDIDSEPAVASPSEAEACAVIKNLEPEDVPVIAVEFTDHSDTQKEPTTPVLHEVAVMRGFLLKRGQVKKTWRQQYFVVDNGMIAYYEDPQEGYPYGNILRGYTPLTFGKATGDKQELVLHIHFPDLTPRQQRLLDKAAKGSQVMHLLEVGSMRELHLKAENAELFFEWEAALARHIEYANIRAELEQSLVIPPEARPKNDEMSNQTPVLERNFSKSGCFTGKRRSSLGRYGEAVFEEMDELEEELPENNAEENPVVLNNETPFVAEHAVNDGEEVNTSVTSTATGDTQPADVEPEAVVEIAPENNDALPIVEPAIIEEVIEDPAGPIVSESNPVEETIVVADDSKTASTETGETKSINEESHQEAGKMKEDDSSDEENDADDTFAEDGLVFEKNVPAVPAVDSGSVPSPEVMRGYLSKRGHFIKNWRKRYFVLENGVLSYYKKELPAPPYGSDLKGFLTLTFAEIAVDRDARRLHITFPPLNDEQKTLLAAAPATDDVAGEAGEGKDLLVEAETLDILSSWETCLRKHADFALSKLHQQDVLPIPVEAAPSKAGGRMKRASVLQRSGRSNSSEGFA